MIYLVISFLFGLISFFITWKVSNFFISNRQRYINSAFGILLLKLGMCLTVASYTGVWVYFLMESYL